MWWGLWVRVFKKNRLAVVGACIVIAFLILAAIGPYVAPYDPIDPDYDAMLAPPSLTHLMGTDRMGRDLFSRVLHGTRVAFYIGFGVVVLEGIVGIALGVVAGYFGGIVDNVIMRLVDVMLSIPALVLAIVIAGTSGGGLLTIIVTMVIVSWAHFARLLRGQALQEKTKGYVEAARAVGASHRHILWRHILPNTVSIGIVYSTLEIPWALVFSAALSFLGIGVKPPAPEWGGIIASGRDFLDTAWWIATFPGVVLMLVVLGFNFVGDGLRDAFDPKQYQRR